MAPHCQDACNSYTIWYVDRWRCVTRDNGNREAIGILGCFNYIQFEVIESRNHLVEPFTVLNQLAMDPGLTL